MSLLFLILISPLSYSTELNTAIGESLKISTQPLETIQVQKKGLLTIKDQGSKILLIGKKLGETRVQVGQKNYHINILHKDRFQTYKKLKKWIKNKRGPKIHVDRGQVVLEGRILRFSDFLQLGHTMGEKAQFILKTQFDRTLEAQTKSYVTKMLKHHNLPGGELITQPALSFALPTKHKKLKSRYKALLNPFGIEVILDEGAIAQAPVIEIKVFIAHIRKSFLREWGLQWPSQASANLIPTPTLEPLSLSLKALENRGQGQLLATPTLITESHKAAEFHSGGEFPMTTTTQFNNSIQWKRYGLFLKTKPMANAQKHLNIHIDLELSTLDHSFGSSDVPALIRSQVKTQVNMKKPQPILLSGFLRQDQGQSQSGLPWLSQIPIFKPLFSNGAIHNNELELVFILVPSFYE